MITGFRIKASDSKHAMIGWKWLRRTLFGFGAALVLTGAAAAQDYPNRPITVIVPFPAGGSTDSLARILSESMRATLGQTVVVQNVAGAGSTLGVTRAIQAAADGYTLSIGNWTSHVGAGAVYPVSWHVVNDLEPVSLLSTTYLIIAGRSGLPMTHGKELIPWLKAAEGQATFATVGAGSGPHICGLYFEQKTGTRVRYVPYRGGAPAMADLMGNQIDFFCGEASQMLPHFKSGRIKPLVVMSRTQWRPMPEVPTMAQIGVPDTYIAFWQGLWAPKGTPKPIITKLNEAVVKAFADPGVSKRLIELGTYHKSEIDKWWPLIKGANLKVE
jgi:tripartite-type tricarboxylate transporter receptor subunit TctC